MIDHFIFILRKFTKYDGSAASNWTKFKVPKMEKLAWKKGEKLFVYLKLLVKHITAMYKNSDQLWDAITSSQPFSKLYFVFVPR